MITEIPLFVKMNYNVHLPSKVINVVWCRAAISRLIDESIIRKLIATYFHDVFENILKKKYPNFSVFYDNKFNIFGLWRTKETLQEVIPGSQDNFQTFYRPNSYLINNWQINQQWQYDC